MYSSPESSYNRAEEAIWVFFFRFLPGCLVAGVSNVNKHLVLAEAEEGESEHFMPFPPIVWLTINDVFFNLLSHALVPWKLLQGAGLIQSWPCI